MSDRFWECHAEGELVAQFNAGHQAGSSVTAMCTDHDQFHYLVTGDTNGYIKVVAGASQLKAYKTCCIFL